MARTTTEQWLTGLFQPVADELDVEGLPVTGELPAGLRGDFLRNGPNAAFPPLGRYHLFDGDGMVHGVRIEDGRVSYRNRWIRSAGLAVERRAGRALYGGLVDFRLPDPEVIAEGGILKNTANTNVVQHAGRIFALLEAAKPTEINRDLETLGEFDYHGALEGPMTAHPKVDPVTGEMVFFGYSPIPPYLRVHSVGPDGTLGWSVEVDLPRPVMLHDFVVTERRVVLFDLPAVFDVAAAMGGGGSIVAWQPEHGARIGVLDRGAPGDSVRWVETDPFYVFHFLNGWDDGDRVVVEGCRAPEINIGFDDVASDAEPATLHRWTVDVAAGTVTEEQVDDRPGDFPRLDDRRAGRPARYGYTTPFREPDRPGLDFGGVVKYDLPAGTSEVLRWGPGESGGEAVFAPDPDRSDEDAGWLLTFVVDRATRDTDLVVADAAALEEVARIRMPRRVPLGFHAAWLPADG